MKCKTLRDLQIVDMKYWNYVTFSYSRKQVKYMRVTMTPKHYFDAN